LAQERPSYRSSVLRPGDGTGSHPDLASGSWNESVSLWVMVSNQGIDYARVFYRPQGRTAAR
jgi:hypothetical protein